MAFHTLTSVSYGISLSPPASLLGHLSRIRFSLKNSRHLLNSINFSCKTTLFCKAQQKDLETWKSTVQPLVLFPSMPAVPLWAANERASQVRVDSLCIRVRYFMAQVLRLQKKGLSTLLTALILANAFYSDIAPPNAVDTFENVPKELNLSGGDKPRRIQRPKSKKAENCTQKCLGTCIRGGAGSPGEGPFNVRRPLVVFKEGFRTRQYCLIECSEICNIIGDGDDGP